MWGIAVLEADRGIWVVCYVAIALRGDNFLSKFRGLSGLSAGVCGFGGGGMGIPYLYLSEGVDSVEGFRVRKLNGGFRLGVGEVGDCDASRVGAHFAAACRGKVVQC